MIKKLLKFPVTALLAALARGILRRYKPKIVMITGSIGKTSTKDAVAAVLSSRWYLRASEKSYNSEFGVPLTIIGAANPWANPVAWLTVLGEALALLLLPNHFPKLLVLEVGADRPGDLKRILKIATPDAVVVTLLPDVPVHVEAYASPAAVRDEEFAPAYALPAGAPLVISADDRFAHTLAARLPAQVRTYGLSGDADLRISPPQVLEESGRPVGMQATARWEEHSFSLAEHGAFGPAQLYAPAAAYTLARAFSLSHEEALAGLSRYTPPPGRARILRGTQGAVLIDDTYNSSPAAVEEILRALRSMPGTRHIAVLGDMLELGRFSREQHERIGALARAHADLVVSVGPRAEAIYAAASGTGAAAHYPDADTAAAALATELRDGDVVLIKGSQAVRMERIVKALLGDPADASLLVRQEKEWLKRS